VYMHSTTIETLKPNQTAKPAQNHSGITAVVLSALALWLAFVAWLAGSGHLAGQPGSPPIAVALSAVVPIIIFLAAFRLFRSFRDFVLNFDLRLATGLQAWRFAGLTFIAFYTNGLLPGAFAWPAGVGDMLVGITAPWIILGLIRRPEFATSKWFLLWNLFGILDLVVAVNSGGLNAWLSHGTATMRPITELPLALIPTYLVPGFVMLHLTALFQRNRLLQSSR
jgi:hypothetical protein